MKKTTFVALLLLYSQCFADSLQASLQSIESEWTSVYYRMPKQKQIAAFPELINKSIQLSNLYPNKAEPLFWQAVIKASYADQQGAMNALDSIHEARDLLIKAIKLNPKAMNGSMHVTLGTLYYMVPKWPVAFGDNNKAKELLETALKINPNGIDSNYYYGDFLLSNNQFSEAENYFSKAASIPISAKQSFADIRLIEEAKHSLKKAQARKLSKVRGLLSLFSTASIK